MGESRLHVRQHLAIYLTKHVVQRHQIPIKVVGDPVQGQCSYLVHHGLELLLHFVEIARCGGNEQRALRHIERHRCCIGNKIKRNVQLPGQ